jgi:transcriptional regulatory protein LEU3
MGEARQTSLDNLAHIANMSHELSVLNREVRAEAAPMAIAPNGVKHEPPRPTLAAIRAGPAPAHRPETPAAGRSSLRSNKKMACVECRQQKSRCDASERHPLACSRCAKKGLQCNLKQDYKRTDKRARIAQIEREFLLLKSSLTSAQAQELLAKVPSLNQASQGYVSDSPRLHSPNTPSVRNPPLNAQTPPPPQPPQPPPPLTTAISPESLACDEKAIGTVTLAPSVISALYLEYVERYHPILPVVDVTRGPERIYRLCPALFWVMMFVSMRRFGDDADKALLLELSPIIKGVLAEILILPVTRYSPTEDDEPILNASLVHSVQAFLLYTYWPPITSLLSADTLWNTIGAALFQAIRLGLHTSTALEHTRTWIICNVVLQTIATAFGFPAFVQFDLSVWNTVRPPLKLSMLIRFMVDIAHFEDQVAKTLNSNPLDAYGLADATERLPLVKVLLKQLDELEINIAAYELPQYHHQLRKFQLLAARIHLLTYYFMDSLRLAAFELQKGLVQVYNAAVALIGHTHMCQAKDKTFVRYLPGVYTLIIWQASCIIGKLAHSSLKTVIDLGLGKQSYLAGILLAAKASILKHDMAYRASGIMRNMWQLLRTLDEKHLTTLSINIRTRMSALVFFDCLFLLREQVGLIAAKLGPKPDVVQALNEATEEGEQDDDDEDEYEEAIELDDDKHDDKPGSVKSTPGSSTSSKTRRKRSLSETVNAESKARRIIRTTPLDPQPIAAPGKRLSIFNVVNQTPSSELLSGQGPSPDWAKAPPQAAPGTQAPPFPQSFVPPIFNVSLDEMMVNESPLQGLENLEMSELDISGDLLWKDVDSVMNDFGFHT